MTKRELHSKKIIPVLLEEGLFYRIPSEDISEELEIIGRKNVTENTILPTGRFLSDLKTKYKESEIEVMAQKAEHWINDTEPVRRSKFALLYTLKDSLTGYHDEQTIHDCCDFLLAVNPAFADLYKRVE